MLAYLSRNKSMAFGITLLSILAIFVIVGHLFWNIDQANPLSAPPNLEPSWDHPLGTDRQARDLLAVMLVGTPKTLYIGFMAGLIGVTIGTILALVSSYYGGWVDAIIRTVIDIGLTIPPLLVLILVAVSLKASLSINQMMLVVASLSWLYPARTIRSQAPDDQGKGLHSGRPVIRLFITADHLSRSDAESPAVSGRHLRRFGRGWYPRIDRSRGSRSQLARFQHPRHYDLLGQLLRRHAQRSLVVVPASSHHHCHSLRRPVRDHDWTRRTRQPTHTKGRLIGS